MAWVICGEKLTHLLNLDAVKDTEIESMQDSNTPRDYQRDDFYVNVRFRDPSMMKTKDTETGEEKVYYHEDDDMMIFRGTFRACQMAQRIIAELTGAVDLEQKAYKMLEAEDAAKSEALEAEAGTITVHPKGTLT